jgi:hypothetical protein
MNKTFAIFGALALLAASTVRAEDQSACETVLCLAGSLQGQSGGSQCNNPIKRYFDIKEKDGMGDFDPVKTADSRMNFLNGCQSVNSNWKKSINDKFGGMKG